MQYDGNRYVGWTGDKICSIDQESGTGSPLVDSAIASWGLDGPTDCSPEGDGGERCCTTSYNDDGGIGDYACYTYDAQGQLIQLDRQWGKGDEAEGQDVWITYDDFGNVMTVAWDGASGSADFVSNYDCWCQTDP